MTMSPVKPYVLVVDDEEPVRRVLGHWLRSWGYEVVAVESADEALERMCQAPAAILVADIIMPVHDGIWLLKQVHERWSETVVIMESGAQDTAVVLEARKYGALEFLPKPFGKEMLRQALIHAMTVFESRTAAREPI
jgi:DNA-binding NtrC family response regulator